MIFNMYFWIIILVSGILSTIIGYYVFNAKQKENKRINKSALIIAIFIPLYVGYSYAETLFEFFPRLTWIDVGALYIIGMISGFFLAVYFIQNKKVVVSSNKNSD